MFELLDYWNTHFFSKNPLDANNLLVNRLKNYYTGLDTSVLVYNPAKFTTQNGTFVATDVTGFGIKRCFELVNGIVVSNFIINWGNGTFQTGPNYYYNENDIGGYTP